jgi:hypothetical protein
MSEEPEPSGSNGNDETDLPIRALAELEQHISPAFMKKVRVRIYRRAVFSQFASFSWTLPTAIFVEFVSIVAHLFSVVGGRDARRR